MIFSIFFDLILCGILAKLPFKSIPWYQTSVFYLVLFRFPRFLWTMSTVKQNNWINFGSLFPLKIINSVSPIQWLNENLIKCFYSYKYLISYHCTTAFQFFFLSNLIFFINRPLKFMFHWILQEINYDAPRGRVAVRTHANEWTTSYLLIHDADITDSGIYVCAPTSGGRTSIKVHVFLHGNFNCANKISILHQIFFSSKLLSFSVRDFRRATRSYANRHIHLHSE